MKNVSELRRVFRRIAEIMGRTDRDYVKFLIAFGKWLNGVETLTPQAIGDFRSSHLGYTLYIDELFPWRGNFANDKKTLPPKVEEIISMIYREFVFPDLRR